MNPDRPTTRLDRFAAGTVVAVLMAATGCGSSAGDATIDESVPVVPVLTDSPVTTVAPPATPPPATAPPATAPPTSPNPVTTTTTEPSTTASQPDATGPTTSIEQTDSTPTAAPPTPIGAAQATAARGDGVFVDSGSRTWDTKVLDDESVGLALLVDDTVAYQAAEPYDFFRLGGPIVVTNGDEQRSFTDGDRALTLHDVGHVDGAAVMLISSSVAMPVGPDDDEERLLLVDLDTFESTDLGQFGGWEDSVLHARFGEGAISLLRVQSTNYRLQIIENDGAIRHDVAVGVDSSFSLLDFDESVWVLNPSFTGADFATPVIGIQQFDLATAEVREVRIELSGVEIPAGFCDRADFLDGRVVCDQSVGGPITFDPDTGSADFVDGLDDARMMFRASQ